MMNSHDEDVMTLTPIVIQPMLDVPIKQEPKNEDNLLDQPHSAAKLMLYQMDEIEAKFAAYEKKIGPSSDVDKSKATAGCLPHQCPMCSKKFSAQTNLSFHIRRSHKEGATYKCTLCSKRFSFKSQLEKHLKSGKCYFCNICKTPFDGRHGYLTLKSHLKTHRNFKCGVCKRQVSHISGYCCGHIEIDATVEIPYKCLVCCQSFATSFEISTHTEVMHPDEASSKSAQVTSIDVNRTCYECALCKRKFKVKSPFIRHLKQHAVENGTQCRVCEKCCMGEEDLVEHFMKEHPDKKPFHCNVCKQTFLNKVRLAMHSWEHNEEHCSKCSKTFTSKLDLVLHLTSHTILAPCKCYLCRNICRKTLHVNGWYYPEKYHCQMCKQRFSSKYRLIVHVSQKHKDTSIKYFNLHSKRWHNKSMLHPCIKKEKDEQGIGNICDKNFCTKNSVESKRLVYTGPKPHGCDICGKTFSRKYKMEERRRVHTGEKPHACDICGKRFGRKNDMQSHRQTHTGEKPHKCDICGKTFYHKNKMREHRLVHTGEKPHECDICGKTFYHKYKLREHRLVHTGEKPHGCDICGRSFRRRCKMKSHRQRHTGEKAHECDICGKTFYKKQNMQEHRRMHRP